MTCSATLPEPWVGQLRGWACRAGARRGIRGALDELVDQAVFPTRNLLRLISHLSGDDAGETGVEEGEHGRAPTVSGRADAIALLNSAWAALDSLEELGEDGRLEAVRSLVERAQADGRTCIILTEGTSDAEYVASYLRSLDIPSDSLRIVKLGRGLQRVWEELSGDRDVLVVSDSAIESLPALPSGSDMIWWSSPQSNLRAREWLAHALTSSSRATAITSEPLPPGEGDPGPIFESALE